MIHGIVYGILISFSAYFTLLSIRLRSISAMWFTFYTVCIGLLLSVYQGDLTGFINSDFENLNSSILLTLIGLLYFSGVKFLRTFVNINLYSESIDRCLAVFQWMGIGFIPIYSLNNPFTLVFAITLIFIAPIFSCVILIFFWLRGIFNIGYFTLGWIIGNITLAIGWMHVFGFTLWISGHPFLLPISMTFSIVFFSFAIVAENRESYEYSYLDHLTGIASCRLFKQTLETEWKRNHRNQIPLSIIIADIDNFKTYNETYGHSRGNECLKTVARLVRKYLRRAGDMAARHGADEFIAVLPDTNASEAVFLAEKIREAVESLAIRHEQSNTGKILTISLGTATFIPNPETSPADILLSAENAILQAKLNGQNRVFSINQKIA
jgi:diguanylate cyclase (GGDEF)-like protein